MNYTVRCKDYKDYIQKEPIYMGDRAPNGDQIEVNTKYLLFNQKPWMPVMGEFHYARYNEEEWEKEILKMKTAGIQIISTYLFWIHHQEEEGVFDFEGARDVRRFVELCSKHSMYVIIRVGPWCHGECRNGGFPDWLQQKGIRLRSRDEVFLGYVKRIFVRYYIELKGLLFKDGGPIIGVQVENEKVDDAEYLLVLKKMLIDIGVVVPIYTITGWGGQGIADFPAKEVLPVFGGYPEAPWEQHTKKLAPNMNYFFFKGRNDSTIGTDQIKGERARNEEALEDYPYFTCELGVGVQNTYHRRPVIQPREGYVLSLVKLGCGNNLPGYYVFHGGSNPEGKLGFYQESKATGYPNDLPVISYDFQAAIGEGGIIRESYHYMRILHLFIETFGEKLATMSPEFAEQSPSDERDMHTTRIATRYRGEEGFVFVNRYQRGYTFQEEKQVQINIELENEVVTIPYKPIDLPKEAAFIWPFNLTLQGIQIKYITAQPICKIEEDQQTTLFVLQCEGCLVSLEIEKEHLKGIEGEAVEETSKTIYIRQSKVGVDHMISLSSEEGTLCIVPLSLENALQLYKGKVNNQERVILSSLPLYFEDNQMNLTVTQDSKDEKIYCYPKLKASDHLKESGQRGIFTAYHIPNKKEINLPEIVIDSQYIQIKDNPYLEYLFSSEIEACKEYRLEIPYNIFETYEEVEVQLEVIGDVVQFYCEDQLIGDYFNNGETLRIELRRWKRWIEQGKKIIIKCSPMKEDADIYLERTIELEKSEVKINKISYKRSIKVNEF